MFKINTLMNEWNSFNVDLDRQIDDMKKMPAVKTALDFKNKYQRFAEEHPVAAAVMMVPWGTITATILSL